LISPETPLHCRDNDKQKYVQDNDKNISIFVEDPEPNTCVPVSMKYLYNILKGKIVF